MPCPTCDHTLSCVLGMEAGEPKVFHCPRCGTLTNESEAIHVPALVGRVKRFRDLAEDGHGLSPASAHLWHRLGIGESIEKPGERPSHV